MRVDVFGCNKQEVEKLANFLLGFLDVGQQGSSTFWWLKRIHINIYINVYPETLLRLLYDIKHVVFIFDF